MLEPLKQPTVVALSGNSKDQYTSSRFYSVSIPYMYLESTSLHHQGSGLLLVLTLDIALIEMQNSIHG